MDFYLFLLGVIILADFAVQLPDNFWHFSSTAVPDFHSIFNCVVYAGLILLLPPNSMNFGVIVVCLYLRAVLSLVVHAEQKVRRVN